MKRCCASGDNRCTRTHLAVMQDRRRYGGRQGCYDHHIVSRSREKRPRRSCHLTSRPRFACFAKEVSEDSSDSPAGKQRKELFERQMFRCSKIAVALLPRGGRRYVQQSAAYAISELLLMLPLRRPSIKPMQVSLGSAETLMGRQGLQ